MAMTNERILQEFKTGSTIESITKQFVREENERLAHEYREKKKRPKADEKHCRNRVETVILKEYWQKIVEV